MNITSISRSILEPFTGGDGIAPVVPGSDFVPSQPGQPPGMDIFAPDEPPAFLNIGRVRILFGCGGSAYESTCDIPTFGTPTPTPTPTPTSTSLGGTTILTFVDTAWPCTPIGGDPTNKEALVNLTCFWSFEFISWFKIQFDYVFAGVCAIEPNGFIDELEIDYTPDMVSTRIRSGPWNGFPRELGHEDPDCQAPPPGNMFIGIVTEKITAASSIETTPPGDTPGGATIGHGKVQIFSPGNGGSRTIISKPVLTNNWFPTEIPRDSRVTVAKIDCQLFIVSASCSSPTANPTGGGPTGGGIPNPDNNPVSIAEAMKSINFFS